MQSSFMGKAVLIISVLLSFCLILSAQSRQIDLSTQSNQTLLKNNSDLGFEVNYRIGQLSLREVNTRAGSFDELSIAGYTHTNAIGEPKLPMQRQLIAVPLGAEVRYSILSSSTRDLDAKDSQLHHRIIPAQEPVSK